MRDNLPSQRLARKIIPLIPPDATLVDISNVRDRQLDNVYAQGRVPVLLSTQKTFDFRVGTKAMPRVAPGTHWIVLLVPHERSNGDDVAHIPTFNASKQRFVSSPLHGSPRLRYHANSKCAVVDAHGHEVGGRVHASCEIDDRTALHVARILGLPLLTNDRALEREAGGIDEVAPPPPSMQLLMRHTRIAVLVHEGSGRWRLRRTRPRKKSYRIRPLGK